MVSGKIGEISPFDYIEIPSLLLKSEVRDDDGVFAYKGGGARLPIRVGVWCLRKQMSYWLLAVDH